MPSDPPPSPPATTASSIAVSTDAPPPASVVPVATPVPANALTPEEQMALFEKDLKENDWGHQPC